jgi:NADH:ubiquinone reductase (H+-translocating)
MVTHIQPGAVMLKAGDQAETIRARTVLWAAGVQGVPLAKQIATATNLPINRRGRLSVQPDCTLPGHPEIFVIGDLAEFTGPGGKPLPEVAPVAIQQGRYVATVIADRLAGRTAPPPFVYNDRGNMATIGRAAAVAEVRGYRFDGLIGWVTWLFVHLLYLVQFENRVLVLFQWAWNYLTRSRSARLITGFRRVEPT